MRKPLHISAADLPTAEDGLALQEARTRGPIRAFAGFREVFITEYQFGHPYLKNPLKSPLALSLKLGTRIAAWPSRISLLSSGLNRLPIQLKRRTPKPESTPHPGEYHSVHRHPNRSAILDCGG